MPVTLADVPSPMQQRAQRLSQRFADDIGAALEKIGVAVSDAAAGAADKSAFLNRAEAEGAPARQTGAVPAPRPQDGQTQRTVEALANRAIRRALQAEMVEAFGAGATLAAFEAFGVALKGEGKYAPLDEARQQDIRMYVSERRAQAHSAVLEEIERVWPDGLPVSEDMDVFMEVLRKEIAARPEYGKEFFKWRDAHLALSWAVNAVGSLKSRLTREASFEEYLRPRAGHDDYGLPNSFDQALVDYQGEHPEHVGTSQADTATFKLRFRDYCRLDTSFFKGNANNFIRREYPLFSDDRRELIGAERGRVYLWLSQMMPRELAGLIAFLFGAVFERGEPTFPAADASAANR